MALKRLNGSVDVVYHLAAINGTRWFNDDLGTRCEPILYITDGSRFRRDQRCTICLYE